MIGQVPRKASTLERAPDPSASAGQKCGTLDSVTRAESNSANSVVLSPVGKVGSWHLRVGQSLVATCKKLNARGVHYVVLPSATEGPAFLIANEDMAKAIDLFTLVPFGSKVAVYTPVAQPGFSFQQHWRHVVNATNMAVLPPRVSTALLERGKLDRSGIRRIGDRDLLNWLIYRALLLSGDSAFESAESGDAIRRGSMAREIRKMKARTGAPPAETLVLDDLYAHLVSVGWEPAFDTLRRLSAWNWWAAAKVQQLAVRHDADEPGLAAFFLRQQAVETGLADDLARMIHCSGFEILKEIELEPAQRALAERSMRGADWGRGQFPVSGGPPARMLFALDLTPFPLADELRPSHPYLDNWRILRARHYAHEVVRSRVPNGQNFNAVHSTDQSSEAWAAIHDFAPDCVDHLRRDVAEKRAAFVTKHAVVRSLTRTGARAKIEVIRYRGGLAVRKTYRSTSLRFLEREVDFMNEMSPLRPEILPVLERGLNYLITPYVDATPLRRHRFGVQLPRLMSLPQVRQLADLLRFLCARGYDPIDLAPHNMLVDQSGNLVAIDFEFFDRRERPVDPETSACLTGIPADFSGECPFRAQWVPHQSWMSIDPYNIRWRSHTGLTLKSFLYDPPFLQRMKRLVIYPAYLGRKAIERPIGILRDKAKRILVRMMPVTIRAARAAIAPRGTAS